MRNVSITSEKSAHRRAQLVEGNLHVADNIRIYQNSIIIVLEVLATNTILAAVFITFFGEWWS
jgi:hypothetical protein